MKEIVNKNSFSNNDNNKKHSVIVLKEKDSGSSNNNLEQKNNKSDKPIVVINKNQKEDEKYIVTNFGKSTKLDLSKISKNQSEYKQSNFVVNNNINETNNDVTKIKDTFNLKSNNWLSKKNKQPMFLKEKQNKEISEMATIDGNKVDINDSNIVNSNAKRKNELSEKKLTKWILKNNKPHKGVSKNKPTNYNEEVIYLENVNKYVTNGFSNLHILKDINLKIKQGEFVVIYGPSGSGKTTLLTLISALDRPTTGICYLVDSNTLGISEHGLTVFRRKNVGYIFQQYGLLNDLTVYDNIKIAASLQKNKSLRIDIDDLLKKVDMDKYKNKKASTLSGGQAQRVAICRAIVKNPKILFGDEPTGAVHVDATKQILQIFKDINKEFNTTIVLVTHNDKILEIASRILKVDNGKITADYYNKNMKSIDEIN